MMSCRAAKTFLTLAGAALIAGAAFATSTSAESRDRDFLGGSRTTSSYSGSGDWWGWGGGGSGGTEVEFSAKYSPKQIIVSFGDRQLYYIIAKGRALAYPIAIPREKSRWSGTTFVSMKRVNPPWTPTPEMRKENPKLPAFVPGGHPLNPLGYRAMYLGSSLYRIHGTDAPWTIGSAVSKGCVRMYNEDVEQLFRIVPVGTKVTVTWQKYMTSYY
jgi:lipoprotein-anchoring transpeptidase ErfK/SrfK